MVYLLVLLYLVCILDKCSTSVDDSTQSLLVGSYDFKCSDLLIGQYVCREPEIDINTQQAKGCPKSGAIKVGCMPAPNITCNQKKFNGSQVAFEKFVSCKWTNGHSFETTLLLSIFLGMFGIDRFYLGYPAIGLLKFSTLGFFFLGQLVDVILIATQIVTPADHSEYVIDFYGAGISRISLDHETFFHNNAT